MEFSSKSTTISLVVIASVTYFLWLHIPYHSFLLLAIPLSLNAMYRYFIKTPWLLKKVFPKYVWSLPNDANEVYLTFDDGPHPEITPWVLDQLGQYNAKATFFCIGNNVMRYPHIYERILAEGHQVGNHTFDHLNGWHTPVDEYIQNIEMAAQHISSRLFRPPYGRIKRNQVPFLNNAMQAEVKVVMWDVLSGDFDPSLPKEQCAANVLNNVAVGSIVVFHDSEKAFRNLQYVLPKVLKDVEERKWVSKGIYL